MLKIFTTQLTGAFRSILESNEKSIEDCSRLIAQTIMSNGTIYVKGFDELEAITTVTQSSYEQFSKTAAFEPNITLKPWDCILVFSSTIENRKMSEIIQRMQSKEVSLVTIAAVPKEHKQNNRDFHIDTKVLNGLIPSESGNRLGYPPFMCALFVYHALYLTTTEILQEYND